MDDIIQGNNPGYAYQWRDFTNIAEAAIENAGDIAPVGWKSIFGNPERSKYLRGSMSKRVMDGSPISSLRNEFFRQAEENLFSNDTTRSGVRGKVSAGKPNLEDLKTNGGVLIERRKKRIPFFNWTKGHPSPDLTLHIFPKVKWTELFPVDLADNYDLNDKRGYVISSYVGQQMAVDGMNVRLDPNDLTANNNIPVPVNAAVPGQFVMGPQGTMSVFTQAELAAKWAKLANTFSALAQLPYLNSSSNPLGNTKNLGTLYVENFERTFEFTNGGNNIVELEFWDCIAKQDNSQGPVACWYRDMTNRALEPGLLAWDTTDIFTGGNPRRFFGPRMASAGERPKTGSNTEFGRNWTVLDKIKFMIPPAGTVKVFIKGNFHITGDKIFNTYDFTDVGFPTNLGHVTRVPMIFIQGQDGVVLPVDNDDPELIAQNAQKGDKIPTPAYVIINTQQQGLYRAIPKMKAYSEVVSLFHTLGNSTVNPLRVDALEASVHFPQHGSNLYHQHEILNTPYDPPAAP